MKIVINTNSLLLPSTGVGTYTYQISKTLREIDYANDYTYFYRSFSKSLLDYNERIIKLYPVTEMLKKIPFAINPLRSFKKLALRFQKEYFDLYFEPNFIPIDIKAKHTIATIFDFSFKLHPEWHPGERVAYFENNFWKNVKQADHLIAISDFTKQSAVKLFGFPEEKITTIHLGYDKHIFRLYPNEELVMAREKYRLSGKFILFIGSIEPRKNLNNLIRAYLSLDTSIRKDSKLVLGGFKGWKNRETVDLLEKTGRDVVYLGYVPYADVGKLYNLATCFVYPSLYEGFGLPPLEAMACGCPVVVSDTTSLPEVCGDAALYVDPNNPESIASGITRMLKDESLRANFASKGIERSKQFSWERSASGHLALFKRMHP